MIALAGFTAAVEPSLGRREALARMGSVRPELDAKMRLMLVDSLAVADCDATTERRADWVIEQLHAGYSPAMFLSAQQIARLWVEFAPQP